MDPALSQELGEIARAIRAQLEWQQASGSFGLPRASAEDLARSAAEVPAGGRELGEPAHAAAAGAGSSPASIHLSSPVRAEGSKFESPRLVSESSAPAPAPAPAQPEPSAAVDGEERLRRLTVLAEETRACTRCGLHAERKQAVFARGTGSVGLCFVGEAPGADEDQQGYPFVGAAGQLLDRMIAAMGLLRDEVYVCNIVKCRPPKNRKPEPDEMAACLPYLEEQLSLVSPQVIVAMGATAVQGLLGTSEGIMRLRGKWKLYKGRVPVMPTFHPAYLLRTPDAKRDVWEDLQAVLRQMGRTIPERRK